MTEPRAGLKRGYYLLNTDGGNSGDTLGRAAIGALLRTPRLVTVAQISKAIGPATHNVAEYKTKIFKTSLLRLEHPGEAQSMYGLVSDDQRGREEGAGVATFFLATFPGLPTENESREGDA